MKIYIHGNCQAPALAELLTEAMPAGTRISSRQVYSLDLIKDRAAYLREVATADVILMQPVSENYRDVEWLSSDWVRANAKSSARVLMFPVVYHRGQLLQCFPLGEFHSGRLAYHDAHAIDYFLRGQSAAEFVRDTATSSFLPAAFVNSEILRSTLDLLKREHGHPMDATVTDIISTSLTHGQPMQAVNHPSRQVMAEMANRLLTKLGREERVELEGPGILHEFIMPPYLSTAIALDHDGVDLRMDEVGFMGAWETREAFYEAVFADYARIGAEALRKAIAWSEIPAYLARYAEVVPLREADQRSLVDALYDKLFGRGVLAHEALHHVRVIKRYGGYPALIEAFATTLFAVPGALGQLQKRYDPTASD